MKFLGITTVLFLEILKICLQKTVAIRNVYAIKSSVFFTCIDFFFFHVLELELCFQFLFFT